MEGFAKIPNAVFELGLTPSQFTVLCNLIRVQSYREYKGEIEDGWFAKSQNELAKECGFKSRKTLTKVLNTMVKNTIVNFTIDKKGVTKFKITIVKNTMVKNTMVNNTIPTMVNFTTLHNNSNKNKEQDNIYSKTNIDLENNNMYLNKELSRNKEQNSKVNQRVQELIDNLKPCEGEQREPTYEELLGIYFKEGVDIKKEDFKQTISGHTSGGKYIRNLEQDSDIRMDFVSIMRNPVQKYGYKLPWSDNKNMLKLLKLVINKHPELDIILK